MSDVEGLVKLITEAFAIPPITMGPEGSTPGQVRAFRERIMATRAEFGITVWVDDPLDEITVIEPTAGERRG